MQVLIRFNPETQRLAITRGDSTVFLGREDNPALYDMLRQEAEEA